VFQTINYFPSELYAGRDGRLYFTLTDSIFRKYEAPGHSIDADCYGGCVLVLHTTTGGRRLDELFMFSHDSPQGYYPRDGIEVEDVNGAIYVRTEEGVCPDGDIDDVLVKILDYDEAEVVDGCGEDLDWSTVTPSGNNDWKWTDSKRYFAVGNSIYAVEPATGMSSLVTTVGSGDGRLQGGIAEASGYLYGITCCGGTTGSGVIFRVRVDSLASPDLLIDAVSAPPLTAIPGQSIGVSDTTRNIGPEPAAASVTKYHLSLTGARVDVKLSGNRYVPELAAGEASEGPKSVKIPASAPLGTYWLIACADAQGVVAESSDTNNCAASSTQITLGRPDLTISAFHVAPVTVPPGAKIEVALTAQNIGTAASPEAIVGYSLIASGGSKVVLSCQDRWSESRNHRFKMSLFLRRLCPLIRAGGAVGMWESRVPQRDFQVPVGRVLCGR
jgi:hypothetical protein